MDNADKLVPEKDAPKPAQNGTATSEVKKVLYKEIGSFVPNYPAGKKPQGAPDKISYPNNPNDPTIPGDFSTITIPYVPGYTPVYNGQELTPKIQMIQLKAIKFQMDLHQRINLGNHQLHIHLLLKQLK